jgi:hypothetical protein
MTSKQLLQAALRPVSFDMKGRNFFVPQTARDMRQQTAPNFFDQSMSIDLSKQGDSNLFIRTFRPSAKERSATASRLNTTIDNQDPLTARSNLTSRP